jgi:hypothetical protein
VSNAAAVRALLPWLRPRAIAGRGPSFGFGDRLGVATPGHVRALRDHPGVKPILAQQSVRELGRTGRTFDDVLAAATFGAQVAGWTGGFGADADHLMTTADIDGGMAAEFTRFSVDPIALVPNLPVGAAPAAILEAFDRLPWASLEDDADAFLRRYPGELDLDGTALPLPRDQLLHAAARFGGAVAHLTALYRHLAGAMADRPFEFEIAVDEIAAPTSAVDHVYIATECRRLGLSWVSLAPRFVGTFEKGIDFLGALDALDRDVAIHAAIAEALGPYVLSVHSGSDKFSTYAAIAHRTRGAVHVKTSGTSYLESLRTICGVDPALFRRIWQASVEAYALARASYHVSARAADMPDVRRLPDADLMALLERPDCRELLHVSYGAVLGPSAVGGLGDDLRTRLWASRETYWARLAGHLGRHLAPFESGEASPSP